MGSLYRMPVAPSWHVFAFPFPCIEREGEKERIKWERKKKEKQGRGKGETKSRIMRRRRREISRTFWYPILEKHKLSQIRVQHWNTHLTLTPSVVKKKRRCYTKYHRNKKNQQDNYMPTYEKNEGRWGIILWQEKIFTKLKTWRCRKPKSSKNQCEHWINSKNSPNKESPGSGGFIGEF